MCAKSQQLATLRASEVLVTYLEGVCKHEVDIHRQWLTLSTNIHLKERKEAIHSFA